MRRIVRVHRGVGAITWYLAEDHLLAADQRWFEMRYRRFYFADVRSIVIWPNQNLWRRMALEAGAAGLAAWGAWALRFHAAAVVLAAMGVAAVAAEAALGHRASARIETVHSHWEGPLAARWRGTEKVLAALAPYLESRVAEGAE